jgi:hypothetical protein
MRVGWVSAACRLRVGQEIRLHFEPGAHGTRFAGLSIDADVDRTVTVRRTDDGFAADERRIRLDRRPAAAVVIRSNHHESATAEGVPPAVVLAAIRAPACSFDLQRDLQAGDLFEVLWSRDRTADGETVRDGPPDLLRMPARGPHRAGAGPSPRRAGPGGLPPARDRARGRLRRRTRVGPRGRGVGHRG